MFQLWFLLFIVALTSAHPFGTEEYEDYHGYRHRQDYSYSEYNSLQDPYDECELTAYPPNPSSLCCGVDSTANNFIIGGNETSVKQYPWLVIIEYYNKTQDRYKELCGGFLISGKYVVTAAHCVLGEVLELGAPVNIRLGDHDRGHEGRDCTTVDRKRECNDGAVRIPIEKITTHPNHFHDNLTNINDISLIRLKRPAPYTDFIRPICLPKTDVTIRPPKNLRVYSAGWGTVRQYTEIGKSTVTGQFSKVKHHVDLPLKQYQDCRKIYGNWVTNKHICAGGEAGKDSCKGDSGGPLMLEKDGVYTAIGIVSFGRPWCGQAGLPTGYTNLFHFSDWIKQNIRP